MPDLPRIVRSELRRLFRRSKESLDRRYHALRTPLSFTFRGQTYGYFYHRYNVTWKNERAVEVPIIWEIVRKHSGRRVLEVGNVLSHYFAVEHDVLDKYEKADRVINEDVVDFHPSVKYDLIVSISTLEHVGWDETPRDPSKFPRAIDNLTHCLAPRGEILVTVPLGYNPEMDSLIRRGKVPFTELSCLRRVSARNIWNEVDWRDAQYTPYNSLERYAIEVLIGTICNRS